VDPMAVLAYGAEHAPPLIGTLEHTALWTTVWVEQTDIPVSAVTFHVRFRWLESDFRPWVSGDCQIDSCRPWIVTVEVGLAVTQLSIMPSVLCVHQRDGIKN